MTAGRSRARARALLFLAATFFGLSALCVRLATRSGVLSAAQVSFARFTIGAIAISAVCIARPGTLRPNNYPLLAVRGIVGGLSGLFYFKGLALIPTGQATLLNNTFPIWAVLLSFLFLRERPTIHLVLALLIATAGVFLVVGGGDVRFQMGRGHLFALASGVCGGIAITAVRALRSNHNAATIFFAFSVSGAVVSSPAIAESWHPDVSLWAAVIVGGLSAFLAQLAMTEAYGALAVAEAAIWQQLTPIASFAFALTLGERITGPAIVGIALGVAGIVYATVLGHTTAAPARSNAPH